MGMDRVWLPSEVLVAEALVLARRDRWDGFEACLCRERARQQVHVLESIRDREAALNRDSDAVGRLAAAVDAARKLRDRAVEVAATSATDVHSLLDEYFDIISGLGHYRDQIDAMLAKAHRNVMVSGFGEKHRDDPGTELHEQELHAFGLVGLALSGGGIRSASYSLGVLQAMADSAMLSAMHYVSAVSGGGYAASWLTVWGYRHQHGIRGVEDELKKQGVDDSGPTRWVRRYGCYLAPRIGTLSSDTWSLIVAYIRNWMPILVFTLSALTALLLLPYCLMASMLYMRDVGLPLEQIRRPFLACAASALLILAAWLRTLTLFRRDGVDKPLHRGVAPTLILLSLATCLLLTIAAPILHNSFAAILVSTSASAAAVASWLLAPALVDPLLAWVGTWTSASPAWKHHLSDLALSAILVWLCLYFAVLLWALLVAGGRDFRAGWSRRKEPVVRWCIHGIVGPIRRFGDVLRGGRNFRDLFAELDRKRPTLWRVVVGSAFAAVVGGLLTAAALHVIGIRDLDQQHPKLLIALGPLITVLIFGLAEMVFVLVTEPFQGDVERAWSARIGGWVLVTMIVWAAISTMALWIPEALTGAADPLWWALTAAVLLFLVWLARKIDLAGPALAGIVGLAIIALFATHVVAMLALLHSKELTALWVLFAFFASAALLLGYYTNVNQFSLHSIYKEGLVRTFLGASRLGPFNSHVAPPDRAMAPDEDRQFKPRHPELTTNVDEDDDPALSWLLPGPERPIPLLLLNAAVNGRSPTDTDGRVPRQWPFTFSALFSGSPASGIGYAGTHRFFTLRPNRRRQKGLTLGTAMAVSGAAMSPASGRSTHPWRAFLLGLLNARLGLWVGNPTEKNMVGRENPKVGGWTLLMELLGIRRPFGRHIHLSDGGHFENLGVYELVRRGCRRIICVDASCDPGRTFEDLENTIRRIQIDLGVAIRPREPWELSPPVQPMREPHVKGASRGWTWFEIDYGNAPDSTDLPKGRMLYIKPTVFDGDTVPVGVRHYKAAVPAFPHETTADQFFTEQQMEAYRSLGYSCARQALLAAVKLSSQNQLLARRRRRNAADDRDQDQALVDALVRMARQPA